MLFRSHAPAVRAVAQMADAGPQDVVLLTVKAHQVADLIPTLGSLLGPQTMLVTMINGVPWWYFQWIWIIRFLLVYWIFWLSMDMDN